MTGTDRSTDGPSFACGLSPEEQESWRREMAGVVLDGLREIRELDDGFAFHFPGGEDVDEKLRVLADWIAGERRCCPFYRFEIVVEPHAGPLRLRLRGEEGVKEYTAGELRDFDPEVPGSELLRRWFRARRT